MKKLESIAPHLEHPNKLRKLLSIEYLPIQQLKRNPANPRIHSQKQVRQVAESIKTFGFNVPVLVDQIDQLIAGHGRFEAAKLLGMTELPAVRVEHLTKAHLTAFAIADNKLTENAQWDKELLAESFKFLSESDLDFSIDVSGFEVQEIELYIEGLLPGRGRGCKFGKNSIGSGRRIRSN
jgi:ParB-like chromosome segregation protein Spo0J